MNVAPGKHKIELAFHPKSVTTTETIAYVAYAVLLLAILLLAYIEYRKKRK